METPRLSVTIGVASCIGRLHHTAAGEATAEAKRVAARDRGTAHPFFWAGFALVAGR